MSLDDRQVGKVDIPRRFGGGGAGNAELKQEQEQEHEHDSGSERRERRTANRRIFVESHTSSHIPYVRNIFRR